MCNFSEVRCRDVNLHVKRPKESSYLPWGPCIAASQTSSLVFPFSPQSCIDRKNKEMATQLLEQMRMAHEDIERYRREIVSQLNVTCKHYRHELIRDHFIAKRIESIAKTSQALQELYSDEEYNMLQGTWKASQGGSGPESAEAPTAQFPAIIRELESRVAALKEYHHRNPQPPYATTLEAPSPDEVAVKFTGPEHFGLYLDLFPHYTRYRDFQLSSQDFDGATKVAVVAVELDFKKYVSSVPVSFHHPLRRKIFAWQKYRAYVEGLSSYLISFFWRLRPLAFEVRRMLVEAQQEVEGLWATQSVRGWSAKKEKVDNLPTDAIEVAVWETQVERLTGLLSDVISRTVAFNDRKLTKTAEELLREEEVEDEQMRESFLQGGPQNSSEQNNNNNSKDDADGDEATDERQRAVAAGAIHKTPQDPRTGEAIPLWLYHLHQLHIKHPCKICGNFEYCGEKAFTQHFSEPRHLEGLRRLGILNPTVHYDNITDPEKAVEMWRALQQTGQNKRLREDEEELEDVSGAVMTRRQRMEYQRTVISRTARI